MINMFEQLGEDRMTKVIQFPLAAQNKPKDPKKLEVEVFQDIQDKLFAGAFDITCPSCGHKSSFEPNGMIFKTLEFYCGGCGYKSKVNNPAVTNKDVIIRKVRDI